MKYLLVLIVLFSFPAFSQTLQPGSYRWQIQRDDGESIIFTTTVNNNGRQMYLINGQDTVTVNDIQSVGDSIHIELPYYESGFIVKPQPNQDLKGYWLKKSAGVVVVRMPVLASYGVTKRFVANEKPAYDITGEWATTFTLGEKITKAGGEFFQNGNKLTGTFRTSYGDYRFLEGVVSGDSVFLSGFDGSMALTFKGKIAGNEINGKMLSRNADVRQWVSEKGAVDIDTQLSKVKPGSGSVNFSFPDINGKMVSLSDPEYKGKVTVIQIMGSWCPNCFDEMGFIMANYPRYQEMGVAFVALAYERTDNFDESKKALQPFLKKFQPPYPVLIPPVAVSDEDAAKKTIPQLNGIYAYPTTIFLDKSGHIAKVHSGFDGPATGDHYIRYQADFENTLKYLAEQ